MAWVNVPTTPGGNVVTATDYDNIVGNLAIVGGSWATYTPTVTGVTLGTGGTTAGRFNQTGKTVDFSVKITLGTSGVLTAGPTITLPATALDFNWIASDGSAYDSSANVWYPVASVATSTGLVAAKTWPGTAGNNLVAVNATSPFTWASGDILFVTGRYEAA